MSQRELCSQETCSLIILHDNERKIGSKITMVSVERLIVFVKCNLSHRAIIVGLHKLQWCIKWCNVNNKAWGFFVATHNVSHIEIRYFLSSKCPFRYASQKIAQRADPAVYQSLIQIQILYRILLVLPLAGLAHEVEKKTDDISNTTNDCRE